MIYILRNHGACARTRPIDIYLGSINGPTSHRTSNIKAINMRTPSLVSFLVYAAVSSVTSAQSISNLTRVNQYECNKRLPFLPTQNAAPWDCAQALLEGFYIDTNVGLFHRGGQPDIFQVPKTSVSGKCYISVNTATDRPAEGRWGDVWTVAQTLNSACTYYRTYEKPSTAVTGGQVEFYGSDGLVLTMGRLTVGNDITVSTE